MQEKTSHARKLVETSHWRALARRYGVTHTGEPREHGNPIVCRAGRIDAGAGCGRRAHDHRQARAGGSDHPATSATTHDHSPGAKAGAGDTAAARDHPAQERADRDRAGAQGTERGAGQGSALRLATRSGEPHQRFQGRRRHARGADECAVQRQPRGLQRCDPRRGHHRVRTAVQGGGRHRQTGPWLPVQAGAARQDRRAVSAVRWRRRDHPGLAAAAAV